MIRIALITLTLIPMLLIVGCNRTWQDPNTSLPAQSVSIPDLLTNKNAYESAGVIVIGKIWDLTHETFEVGENRELVDYTIFTLADRKGVGVNVYVPSDVPLVEGNYVRVVGVYRREFETEYHNFTNRIEAVRLENWHPGLGYWIREYEFD